MNGVNGSYFLSKAQNHLFYFVPYCLHSLLCMRIVSHLRGLFIDCGIKSL